MSSTLHISAAHTSIAGVKPENEDACGFRLPDEPLRTTKGAVAVIADGMSGAEAGKVASAACTQGFLSDYFSTPESWAVKSSAQKVLAALNRWLYGNGTRQYGTNKGMVTTFSAVVFKSNTAYLFHVGDTRIYRLRGDDFEPLTQDHRIQVSEEKTYLARAMGIELHVDIDFRTVSLEEGDLFLLTTDGVHEFMSDSEMRALLKEAGNDLQAASERIVQLAVERRSDDNLTAQVVQVHSLPGKDELEFYRDLTKLPFPPSLAPGMVLDGYKILRELFSNKRTEVFLAQDTESGEQVVIKAPSVNFEDDPDYINQFLHEEWAGRRINNPHVMRVLEQKRERHFLYYVTEYIEGRTLRQWMHDEPRPSLSVVRDLLAQVARGLRAFHRLEMIHQDLKPENIIIDAHGTAKIIDMGSTKIAGIEEISTPLDSDNPLGTIDYSAPEMHLGDPASARADLFSLAVMAYEMLSGKLPFDKELNKRNLKRLRYVPVKHYNPEVPYWMDKALEKALYIDPSRRYERLSEFLYDLNHPNEQFLKQQQMPLIERNPIAFWRGLSIILLLLNVMLLVLLS